MEAEHRAPCQTMWPGFHCHDNLEKKISAQLLPQPQEGLTSHGLTHCPASDTALYVPASLHCDGSGDCCIVDGLRANSLRKAMFHIVSVILSSYTFILPTSALYPPSLCLLPTPSKGKEDKGKAQMGGGSGQEKHTWSVLNWVLPKLQILHSHGILMHPSLSHGCTTVITTVLCLTHWALWSNCRKLLPEKRCRGGKKIKKWMSDETTMPEKESIWKYYS